MLSPADIEAVRDIAHRELREEAFRREVEKMKLEIRNRRSIWDRLWPWRILIVRKDRA